jgi:LmbE family N-acetylglucosaminyl deacetylase
MINLNFELQDRKLRLLLIGAHSDDIEIGCAGTVLEWFGKYDHVEITWVVLSASGLRAKEAHRSAEAILHGAKRVNILIRDFRDGYLPSQFEKVKNFFEDLKANEKPDIIFTHRLEDRHQDHRLAAELTWQTFRNTLILEYEIPKYEGDLGLPNLFVTLSSSVAKSKIEHLKHHFGSQRSKDWFRPETFTGLMQIRGIECRAHSGYAEAFHMRKGVI